MFTQQIEKITLVLCGIFVAIALIACAPSANLDGAAQPASPDENMPETGDPLTNTGWNLISLDGTTIATDITLEFAEGMVSGSDGCNGYGATYTMDGDSLTFNTEGFMSTMMACEESIMDIGAAFLTALQNSKTFSLDGDRLTIATDNGALTFERAMAASTGAKPSLENTRWTLKHMVVGGDAVATPPAEADIFLQIKGETASGNAGCNNFNGGVMIDGDELQFGMLATTRMYCESTSDYEQGVLDMLAAVIRYEIDQTSGTLQLFDNSDLLRAEFIADS